MSLTKFLKFLARLQRWHILMLGTLGVLVLIAELQSAGERLGIRLVYAIFLGMWAMIGVGYMAAQFVSQLYKVKPAEGFDFVQRRLFGIVSLEPYLLVKEGKLQNNGSDPLVRIGGPGMLFINSDSAVVLEKAGKLTRAEKTGVVELGNFEKIWDVLDLRPQHWVYDVTAMSKEGIPLTCQADVSFKIDDGGQPATQAAPYPASRQAIFKAATRKWMRDPSGSPDDQFFDWARRAVIGNTEGALRNILATYLLD
jgi:hypothetical protein